MWEKIKLFWKISTPEIIRLIKAFLKFGFVTIFKLAIEGVEKAEVQFPGKGNGKEKLKWAVDYVKTQAPEQAAKSVLSAVQDAWMVKESEGWK